VSVTAAAGGRAQRRLGEAYDAAGVLKPDLSAPSGVVDDDLPKCGMATNCFDCFQQQVRHTDPHPKIPNPKPWIFSSRHGTLAGQRQARHLQSFLSLQLPLSPLFPNNPYHSRFCSMTCVLDHLQECYANPFGTEPICSPCGWCTNGTSQGDSLR
jgi:hypothetical protein